jgi:hypothetical protein
MKRQGTNSLMFTSLLLLGAFVWTLASAPAAKAIPAFARKYQTSCTTCHSNFPELNDFGEAFKKNGFKFPKDDDLFVKEPPVMLGAKAQKEVFPNTVYPGELPGNLPIAFRYSGYAQYHSKVPFPLWTNGPVPRTDLFAPNTFTIIAAGSFGPMLSFWIDDDLSTGGSGADGGLGDGYIKANDIGHYLHLPKDALNVRFGQFELDLPFTQARTMNLSDYDVYDQPSVAGVLGTTNNPFLFGETQRGIEFGGYPNDGNFSWSVAIVNDHNSDGPQNNFKNVYVRLSQRFNLERDPAVRKEVQAAGPTGPRDHTSVRVGAFGLYGRNAQYLDGLAGSLREPFYRVGGDVRFRYRQLELWGLGMFGHDANHFIEEGIVRARPVTYTGGFGEAEYWFYPWLIGTMRYDFVNSPTDYANGISRFNTRNRFSPGFQMLVRANIKIGFEYQRTFEQPYQDPACDYCTRFFRANGFTTGADFVF